MSHLRVHRGTPGMLCCATVASALVVGAHAGTSSAAPFIVAPDVVQLELIATDAVALKDIDMLEFDALGNLLGNRETFGATGGTSYIDIDAGTATILVSGISRADGITLHPSGAMYVTSELSGASTSARIYRVDLTYDLNDTPISATATSIFTSLPINNPEGIVALTEPSGFGLAGDLYVAEDSTPGRIFHLTLVAVNSAIATRLVDFATNLRRPEGIAMGDFGGALPGPLIFACETTDDNVLSITSTGTVSVLGNPSTVTLDQPDNAKFGHDGQLYVSEDIGSGNGRIIRIAANGTHEVLLDGFNFPQGMAFDDARSDMYIAEQGSARVWRARFATATGDADGDGDVDLRDHAAFQRCFDDPAFPLECLVFDDDRDDFIDASDTAAFVAAMTPP